MGPADDMPERIAHPEADAARAGDGALVKAFVRRHFSLRGALRTHRLALGPDLLRAPLNVALAPVFILVRLTALLLTRLRLRRAGGWLASRRILLRSDVSRAIESALIDEVLHPRMAWTGPPSATSTRLIEDYVGIRSAVAEIVTTLIVLCLGVIVFHAATPGVLSLAPLLSDRAATAGAIADFPLGSGLGRVWYGAFPLDLSGWFVAGVAVLLVMAASILTAFAGVVADPIQARLGIHRRRLMRLLVRLDEARSGEPEIAREHLFARMADLTDVVTALLRMLRP